MPKLEMANIVSKQIHTPCIPQGWCLGRLIGSRPGSRRNRRKVRDNHPRVPERVSLTHSSSNETHVFHQETDEGKNLSILVLQIYYVTLHDDKDVIIMPTT